MNKKTKVITKTNAGASGLVPKLRFPKFRKAPAWNKYQVDDIFQVTRGEVLSMSLVQDEQTSSAPYPVYSSQTKNNGLAGFYSSYLYEDAITWTTDGANAGDVNYRAGKFYCTNVCGVLLSNEGHANPCVAQIINSVSKNYVSYVGNPKLMNGVMAKIKIALPKIDEQSKISDCLSSMDELIAAEGQKVEALKAHKKGMMQLLFPAEGETVPKLRFPEFRNAPEWLPVSLKDVCNMQSGKFIAANEIYEACQAGMYSCYGGNGLRGYTNTHNTSGKFPLIGRQGALCGNVNLVDGDYYATEHALVARPETGIDVVWLYYLLDLLNLNRFATGQAQPGLSVDVLQKVPTSIPSTEREQQKIADCLSSLGELIAAQTQKVEALTAHKNGLMQQLFPVSEAGE